MPIIVRVWVLLSALLAGAGWILSAFHQLNRAGYAVVITLAIGFLFLKKDRLPDNAGLLLAAKKIRRRFQKPAPFLFLTLALLSLFSGGLYEVLNWDSNAYRLPRIFHWLWNGQWHWIHTTDLRMNIAGCNFEWLAAPLVLFSHSDRLLFFINWLPYLMLPGLIFSVFTRLQVGARVAWWWMWFLSAGWCFVFQASSAANDSLGAVYALAAMDLMLRGWKNKKISDLWLSMLAIAFATGIKQTNILLALPWLAALWPNLWLLRTRPLGTAIAAGFALLVSIVPVSFFNWKYCGAWLPVQNSEIAAIGKFHVDPFWGVAGNLFCLPVQNLLPPFYELLPPFYNRTVDVWNNWMSGFTQTPFGSHFVTFEKFGFLSGGREHGVSEANAGIGLGLCILLAVSILAALRFRTAAIHPRGKFLFGLRLTPWLALLIFMAKVGSYENARQLAPYYPLLFPAFLVMAGNVIVVRRRLWQRLGLATMVFTAVLVITLAERPLFPPGIVIGLLHAKFPDSELVAVESVHYLATNCRGIAIRRSCLRQILPPDAKVVGYFAGTVDGDEPGIWLPYGRRSVEWILPKDSPADVRAAGVRYMLVSRIALLQADETIQRWLEKYNARLIGQFTFTGEFPESPTPDFFGFYLIRLN